MSAKPASQKTKSPSKKTDKLERSPEEIAEAKRLAEENAAKAKEIHRNVVDTIVSMVDTIGSDQLIEKLHLLDVGSWDEVVEERYLARFCGFPTCDETVTVNNYMGKKYWIQKREKKIYTAIPKVEKFCSRFCYERSNHIQMQLYEEPLWMNWERKPKQYQVDLPHGGHSSNKKFEDIFSQETDRLLVTRLNDLKIAENRGSDSEEDADSEDEEKGKKTKMEDDEFVSEIRSFVSSVSSMSKQKMSSMSGAGGASTDINNPKAREIAEKNRKKFENLTEKDNKEPAKVNVNKETIVRTSGRLEKLIQDIAQQDEKENAAKSSKVPDEKPKEPQNSVNSAPTSTKKPAQKLKKKVVQKEEPLSPDMEEKLARLRSKFGNKPNSNLRKPPILIEPPKLDAQLAAKMPEDLR
ncbi:unnamed protein product [Bursaphelenchus xylophilus]|uniref:RNA polymerase II subunit B1 CTD phosphatase RPAP2 homolog n=1 Tax=Bursaphelenchus xylophilus TaxID=6326 RepID=A0A1I7RK39_BURXY|nr:unnamed protein product [Bursaphelenchus xylophilus]CAG9131529.1 unnamed protein product [Bursaphelenchus xylophilus]